MRRDGGSGQRQRGKNSMMGYGLFYVSFLPNKGLNIRVRT